MQKYIKWKVNILHIFMFNFDHHENNQSYITYHKSQHSSVSSFKSYIK